VGIPLNLENDTKKRVQDDVRFYSLRKSMIMSLGKSLKNTKGGGVLFCFVLVLNGGRS